MTSNTEFEYDLGVVGLGYVGLPLAVESSKQGLKVIGYDINPERVEMINNGISPIEDISNDELSNALNNFHSTLDSELLSRCQNIVISVPTPFSYFTEDLLKFLIGVIGTLFTLNYFIKFNQEIIREKTSKLKGSFWGIISGFAGFCAHSGGTPISVYLVPLRLEKAKYIGTRIIYFFALNIFKLTFYIPLNMINLENLKYTLILVPWIPVGIYIGIWLQENCSEKIFYNIIYSLIFISSVNLLINNYQSIF